MDGLWQTNECSDRKPFLCQSCDGELNKYIFHIATDSHANSQDYCRNMYGTDLASVHSERDQDEVMGLCDGYKCWLGLHDGGDESIFEWTDGSMLETKLHIDELATDPMFDYGEVFGEYPWSNGEPNDYFAAEECVQTSRSGRWNDISVLMITDIMQ